MSLWMKGLPTAAPVDWRVVDRPTVKPYYGRSHPKWLEVHKAILAASEEGRALEFDLNGQSVKSVQSALRRRLNKDGLHLRSFHTNGRLTCWVADMSDDYLWRGVPPGSAPIERAPVEAAAVPTNGAVPVSAPS